MSTPPETFAHAISQRLRAKALSFPETSEGTSCVNRAFKVRKKNFVFVGEKDDNVRVMVKLSESLDAARALGDPRIGLGSIGWVTLNFAPDDAPDPEMLEGWIEESFRTLAPKTVVRKWEAGG
ncbi:MAG: MmcQ/YjbR family DNA-binding protein [Thermoanaerobaculia bacterium]